MDPPSDANDLQTQRTKEIFLNQTDSGCETSTIKSVDCSQTEDIDKTATLANSPAKEDEEDIVILRRDPATNRKLVDKTAYAKLQRSLSPSRNSNSLSTLKEKYEPDRRSIERKPKLRRASAIKLDEAAVHSLRNKSKLPVAKPRSAVKSEIYISHSKPVETAKFRYTLIPNQNPNTKDENSNELFRKNSSSSGEFVTIVTRTESEGSVDKLGRELDLFTMDRKPKEKKRSNSFKKIFSGKIFGKEKKKKEEELSKLQDKQNAARSDNMQNETNAFARDSPYRHTTGGNSYLPKPTRMSRIDRDRQVRQTNSDMKEIEKQYAQMHVREFNNIKQNFDNQNSDPNESPVIVNNPGPMEYKNMPNISKFIDTSSSVSTLESDRSNANRQPNVDNEAAKKFNRFGESHRESSRDTPPRAQELRQDLRLVNPKALIPINSERALPNPYQNQGNSSPQPKTSSKPSTLTRTFQFESKDGESKPQPRFEEAYGTVFDSLAEKNLQRRTPVQLEQKPPRSPSLESSKLRLPPNREITPLSPRMRSPIPQHHVSTEKIIATELLKPRSRSPTPTRTKKASQLSPSHQTLELGIDYPDNINNEKNERDLASKPPISRLPDRSPVYAQRISQQSPSFENRTIRSPSVAGSVEKVFTNVQIHTNNTRTPTPNSLLHNRSLSPMGPQSLRSSTPDMRGSSSNKSQSPQKEEMRKSVEAYYWKEIKRLKDQENMELYFYQAQVPFGYAEDPIRRRSRSSSPSSQRNGRRSLSLPRDPKPVETNDVYGRFQPTPIPEGRAVVNHHPNGAYYHTNFKRNTPERRTIDTFPRTNGNYANGSNRPIFKRGSLTTPVRELSEDQQNKKVSFGNPRQDPQSNQAWPSRNGFTQSPPQRRLEKNRHISLDDDVFLPNPPQTSKLVVDGKEVYGYANRPYGISPSIEYVSRQQLQQNPSPRYRLEPVYGSRQQIPPHEEVYYGNGAQVPYGMTRHGSIQLAEPLYGQQRVPRRMSQDSSHLQAMRPPLRQIPVQSPGYPTPRRQIIVQDDIYGQFGGYIVDNPNEQQSPVYASRQNVVESPYGYNQGVPKHISMNNKVCDIYGQIHDRNSPSLAKPNQLRQSGVILGQLQSSPQMVRQSHTQLPSQSFVRNSRLTASANDMYRRQQQGADPRYVNGAMYSNQYPVREDLAPTRPLPPVPTDKRVMMRQSLESSLNASDIQRVNSINGKSKKRGMFGNRANDLPASNLSRLEEETKRLSTSKLERLVLLEKLRLLRMEQQLEKEKRECRTENHSSTFYETADAFERKECSDSNFLNPEILSETDETKKLRLSDLKRIVLLEELYLIRMRSSIKNL